MQPLSPGSALLRQFRTVRSRGLLLGCVVNSIAITVSRIADGTAIVVGDRARQGEDRLSRLRGSICKAGSSWHLMT